MRFALQLFYPCMICLYVQVPDAVAGPTPLSLHNSVIAVWTSGNKLNALLVILWTASSLFEPISCCKRGRNFPFCDRTANHQRELCFCEFHETHFFLSDVIICVYNNQWEVTSIPHVSCNDCICFVLTVSFHSMILVSSACVRERSDRDDIAVGSSSWNLMKMDCQ